MLSSTVFLLLGIVSPLRGYFTLFIHFRMGAVTELSAVFGENTNETWL